MTMALTKRENNSPARTQGTDVVVRAQEERSWAGAIADVFESADDYLIFADVPGVKLEGIHIEYRNHELRLEARRTLRDHPSWSTDFRRIFTFGGDVDVDRISAELKDGVLEVRLPKLESAKPRQIAVRNG